MNVIKTMLLAFCFILSILSCLGMPQRPTSAEASGAITVMNARPHKDPLDISPQQASSPQKDPSILSPPELPAVISSQPSLLDPSVPVKHEKSEHKGGHHKKNEKEKSKHHSHSHETASFPQSGDLSSLPLLEVLHDSKIKLSPQEGLIKPEIKEKKPLEDSILIQKVMEKAETSTEVLENTTDALETTTGVLVRIVDTSDRIGACTLACLTGG